MCGTGTYSNKIVLWFLMANKQPNIFFSTIKYEYVDIWSAFKVWMENCAERDKWKDYKSYEQIRKCSVRQQQQQAGNNWIRSRAGIYCGQQCITASCYALFESHARVVAIRAIYNVGYNIYAWSSFGSDPWIWINTNVQHFRTHKINDWLNHIPDIRPFFIRRLWMPLRRKSVTTLKHIMDSWRERRSIKSILYIFIHIKMRIFAGTFKIRH